MGKISKRFATSVSVLGSLCLIWGVCISVISWVLANKAPTSISYTNHGFQQSTTHIHAYWWGGLGFVVPGILGIVAGCTRNVVAMVFFLIFDILCLLASIGMSVLVGLVVVAWGEVNMQLKNDIGGCTSYVSYGVKSCVCLDISRLKSWTLNGASCEDLKNIQVLLVALVALGALAAFMSAIASYVSCCSFCSQEEDFHGTIIVKQPQQCAAPTPMVVTNINNVQQVSSQQYPPTSAVHQAPPPYAATPQHVYPTTNDKAKLVQNEVL